MRGDDKRREPAVGLPDRALWRLSGVTDAAEDDAERLLDLAGFVDGCLDPDDRERIAALLASDPAAAGDVAAAQALASEVAHLGAAPESVIARASALVRPADQRGVVVRFPAGRRDRRALRAMANWGSLAAAMAVASWLGFTLGMDTSRSFAQRGQAGEDGFLSEMLDPSAGFMRDLTEGSQT